MLEMKFTYTRFTLDYPPFSESFEGREMQDYIEYLEKTTSLLKSYLKIKSDDNLSYTVFKTFDGPESAHEFADLIRLKHSNFWKARAIYIKEKKHQLLGISNYKIFPIVNTADFTDRVFIK